MPLRILFFTLFAVLMLHRAVAQSDSQLADYLTQVGVPDYKQYEAVLILPPHLSPDGDDFWLDFVSSPSPFKQVLVVLVIRDRKQLNTFSRSVLERKKIYVDEAFLFHQQSFFQHHPVLIYLEKGKIVKAKPVLSANHYHAWTDIHRRFLNRRRLTE